MQTIRQWIYILAHQAQREYASKILSVNSSFCFMGEKQGSGENGAAQIEDIA